MKTWIPILAILGGISGVVSGALVGVAGGVFGDGNMAESGGWVFFISFLAIVLGFTAWKWSKISGWLLIAISVIGLIMNGLFFALAFIFLLIAGIMATRYGSQKNKNNSVSV
ncbi:MULTISPECIES: hypothetical protein [Metabacillus]|uniref:Uncharacterized protein n=1 Tax=Metabacillus hrfriensis TaxID=3048891 RepID=A0ACD4R937_9BACI|nr:MULTISPECIES: hypothetical protein [Metabacillus]UAL51493.1 hypothetical protein K8L98_20265 [Metabacillus dongyingensis]UOK57400.1 hypothetical protein MGI18_23280 [Bacillus sp. OVS6]USK27795.1 hypothetical protein LIT32_20425 [Bacillus sp. CMF21]WHZ57000.1 hypothetical protein QLQ22_20415 [Metabacillus sp. CT-WN-B3]